MADVKTQVDEIRTPPEPVRDGAPSPAPPAQAPPAIAGKAKDLEALRNAVVDAANVGAGLWFSYLFVLLYLIIAVGSVTHRNLLFESPVKLPFLNVDLPLIGFFVLGPALFLIVHAYVLLHFAMLADKVGVFHAELQAQIADENVRARLRRQLPSNIFVQFLAGPIEVRSGVMGAMLRLIAQISLVAGPLALFVFFQFQFLPYHHEAIAWWQRLAVVADLALLWTLWPSVARGETTAIRWRDFRRGKVAAAALASLVPVLLVFTIATFPGEWLHKNPVSAPMIPEFGPASIRWVTPHEFLVAGDVDLVARKPTSLWSNRLVLPGLDVKPDGFSLRGRRLEGAVLLAANLQKMDFTAAQLQGAVLNDADLREAKFLCADTNLRVGIGSTDTVDPEKHCTQLQGASLYQAKLQGASLVGARLQGASLESAQLPNAALDQAQLQGARLDRAQLQGASFNGAELQDARLSDADLRGATLVRANLDRASLAGANLQGAQIEGAMLRGAWLDHAQLQGAMLRQAQLSGASLEFAELQGAVLDLAIIRGASLAHAQLQGAALHGAWLEGTSLADAQLHGAALDGAHLNGASLDRAGLQGTTLENAQLRSATLQGIFAWRADARKIPGEGTRVVAPETAPKFAGSVFEYSAAPFQCPVSQAPCAWSVASWVALNRFKEEVPEGDRQCPASQAPCEWSATSFAALKRFIEVQVPEGDGRRQALERIATLDPATPMGEQEAMASAWADLARATPSPVDYDTALAEMWRQIGCNMRDAPFVVRGLLRSFDDRFAKGSPGAKTLATALLEVSCPGTQGLSDDEMGKLRAIRDSVPPPPTVEAPPDPPPHRRRHSPPQQ